MDLCIHKPMQNIFISILEIRGTGGEGESEGYRDEGIGRREEEGYRERERLMGGTEWFT